MKRSFLFTVMSSKYEMHRLNNVITISAMMNKEIVIIILYFLTY